VAHVHVEGFAESIAVPTFSMSGAASIKLRIPSLRSQRPKSLATTKLFKKGEAMGTILLIILILLLIGALPAWPYSSGWGYWPSGGLGLILLIVIILALMGHL
jgi:hypothetical protein